MIFGSFGMTAGTCPPGAICKASSVPSATPRYANSAAECPFGWRFVSAGRSSQCVPGTEPSSLLSLVTGGLKLPSATDINPNTGIPYTGGIAGGVSKPSAFIPVTLPDGRVLTSPTIKSGAEVLAAGFRAQGNEAAAVAVETGLMKVTTTPVATTSPLVQETINATIGASPPITVSPVETQGWKTMSPAAQAGAAQAGVAEAGMLGALAPIALIGAAIVFLVMRRKS